MKIPKLLRRVCCGALVVVWLVAMLTPCAVVVLATQGEIKITYSDSPEDEFRVWTVFSTGTRGIAFSNSRRITPNKPLLPSGAKFHVACKIEVGASTHATVKHFDIKSATDATSTAAKVVAAGTAEVRN